MTFSFKGYVAEVFPALIPDLYFCRVYFADGICEDAATSQGGAAWKAMQIINIRIFDKSRKLTPKN